MLCSMTGFNRIRQEFPWGTLTMEISSVNSRYLEITVRTDRALSGFEASFQNTLRSRLSRGKVLLRAEVKWAASRADNCLNEDVLRDYYRKMQKIQREVGGPVPSITSLLSLPGVTQASSLIEENSDEIGPAATEVLEKCISAFVAMRGVEGEALSADVLKNLSEYNDLLKNLAAKWQKISSEVFEAYREKITKNIAQLGYEADPARLAQELVYLADKWDISEELTRSESHVAQFEALVKNGGTVGRKLDFLVQEMNREINTIGSKSASTELRWLVVDGKTLLERIREQIQNVE